MATPEETKPLEQSYHYQTDQQVSVNAFFDVEICGETTKIQITNRYGSTAEKIVRTVTEEIKALTILRQQFPRDFTKPAAPQQPAEPTRQPIDDGGNPLPDVKTATAGRLSWEVHDGKTSYKVMDAIFAPGERGTKFGITVWPEVLKDAKLNVEQGQPTPNISGWRVDYVCNDKGYPQKVTRLTPPK